MYPWTSCGDERRPRLHKKREHSRIVLPWAIIHRWEKTVSKKSVSEKERKREQLGKVVVSAPKLTMRILFSRARAIFLPHRHHCVRGLCMPLWHNNVHCTSEQCYPSVSLYNHPPCIPAVSRLIVRQELVPFFRARFFGRINDTTIDS